MTPIERMFNELEKQDKTITSLCHYLNVKTNVVANWKKKSNIPPSKYIVSICEFLNITCDYFLTGIHYSRLNGRQAVCQDEQELIDNYRLLDSRGKHILHTVLYEQLDRTAAEAGIVNEPAAVVQNASDTDDSQLYDVEPAKK